MRGKFITFSPSVLKDWLGIDEVVEASDEELTKDAVASDLSGMNGRIRLRIRLPLDYCQNTKF